MAGRYLSIKGCEDEIDLRTVSARTTFLKRMDRNYKMKDLDVVCFTNKLRTRFRLVLKVRDVMLMCVPEVEADQRRKYSMYLRVSESLAKLGGLATAVVKLGDLTDFTKERIVRIKKRRKSIAA